MKTKALLVIDSALTVAAHGAAMLEAEGLVTEKTAGWLFEASGAKGGDEIVRGGFMAVLET